MNNDKISLIREAIAQARAEEAHTRQLAGFVGSAVAGLHGAIDLPDEDPARALAEFVVTYIEQVPDFLQVLDELMRSCGLHEQGRVFLNIAEDFFLQPPELVKQCGGLRGLIDEAYLAHRLMEEVNDRLIMLCGIPLTPWDMTMANIVVHGLLGETYANELDLAVHYALEALFEPGRSLEHGDITQFVARYQSCDWEARLRGWPSLAGDTPIRLRFFDVPAVKTTAH